VVLAVAAATMLATSIVRAADTVTGEVVDLACYLAHPETSKGAAHKKCAHTCANKGLPMGLLADDSQVCLPVQDHDNPTGSATALDSAAETVRVEGRKGVQGGLNGIVVEPVE